MPDTAARDALARAMLWTNRDADTLVNDLATRGYVLHPVTCPGPLDAETLAKALRHHAGPGYFPGTQSVDFIVEDGRDPAEAFAAAIVAALAKPAP